MKIQILHCGAVTLEDEEPSKKPKDIAPKRTGDIIIEQHASLIEDSQLSALLEMFENIEVDETYNSPIQIKYPYLQEKLGLTSTELKKLMAEAKKQKLLRRLTIDKDYGAWIEKSRIKGCLVIMICIEKGDYRRQDLPSMFYEEVKITRNKLMVEGKGHKLDTIVLVPNAHMVAEQLETNSQNIESVMSGIRSILEDKEIQYVEASFGYGKRVKLIVRGHAEAYKFHQI